jgi:sortase A
MAKQDSDEKTVPLGVVFITIGLMVVALAAAILFVQPTAGQAAAATRTPLPLITVVITPVPESVAEGVEGAETADLPTASTEISLPANLVSLADAPRGSLANQPQRIVIPSIAVDAPVTTVGLTSFEENGQQFYQWQVPSAYEAGWHNTSAPPGQPGNTVLNGHHNIFGEIFGKLVDLEVGSQIMVYDAETAHTYTVAEIQILPERDEPLAVRTENAQWIQPTNDERLTLVTCWPHTDNSHRLIVVAYPTDSN